MRSRFNLNAFTPNQYYCIKLDCLPFKIMICDILLSCYYYIPNLVGGVLDLTIITKG